MNPYTLTDAEAELRAAINDVDEQAMRALEPVIDKLDQAAQEVTVLAAALWYAEQGLHVFPLQPGSKVPHRGTNGCKDGTTDPDAIRAWWERWPDSNVAIATGHLIDVVDVDGLEGQRSRAVHWDDTFGRIDADAVAKVLTPRPGGMHLYVPATGDGNSAGIVPGIDYRGLGGYVVAPPSRTEQGTYRFLGTPRFAAITSQVA